LRTRATTPANEIPFSIQQALVFAPGFVTAKMKQRRAAFEARKKEFEEAQKAEADRANGETGETNNQPGKDSSNTPHNDAQLLELADLIPLPQGSAHCRQSA
jgi:hypothetical protein